ncbi:MAG: hypothetical protein HY718_05955 [Planctomycetes bacterium]|nr:hypothetical protein [Planctomycetota bacterium]
MTTSTRTSVRIPRELLTQTKELLEGRNFSQVVQEALADWVRDHQRVRWGDLIEQTLKSRSASRRAEHREIAALAGESTRRIVEGRDHAVPTPR